MTVAEQTFEAFQDDGSHLAKVVSAAREARAQGRTDVTLVWDMAHEDNAGFNPGPLMDSLMTLGFSRSWAVSDDGQTGVLAVSW